MRYYASLAKYIFFAMFIVASVAHGRDKSCERFRARIEKVLVDKKIDRKILAFADLHQESKEDYDGYKLNEEPGCLCEKLDRKATACAIILISTKTKSGPSIYVAMVEKDPVELIKVDEFNTYYGGKQDIFLVPKKKTVLENRGKGADRISMPNDGIELVNPGKSAFTIFIKDSKLQQIWTSD